jgi:aromatic ring-opening dioxygenase catalytic subunit (LigB family)
MKMPTYYIAHGGGPCFFMDWSPIGPSETWNKMGDWLKNLSSQEIPLRPKAVVVISAHWEESEFTVLDSESPPLLFDYYGFPKHTYELEYPAHGSKEVVMRIQSLMERAGLPLRRETNRGYDHGVFVPLLLIYPKADIQVSLKKGLSPEQHFKFGQALAPLRDEGILLIGSGMSYHNLREFFGGKSVEIVSDTFDSWLTETVQTSDLKFRNERLLDWEVAPSARDAHPREEHLVPLFVMAGAAAEEPGKRIFTDRVMGATTSAYRFGKNTVDE